MFLLILLAKKIILDQFQVDLMNQIINLFRTDSLMTNQNQSFENESQRKSTHQTSQSIESAVGVFAFVCLQYSKFTYAPEIVHLGKGAGEK